MHHKMVTTISDNKLDYWLGVFGSGFKDFMWFKSLTGLAKRRGGFPNSIAVRVKLKLIILNNIDTLFQEFIQFQILKQVSKDKNL